MIRANKNRILDKNKYFKDWGNHSTGWTKKNMSERGVNLEYPEKSDGEWMWASWFPSVVYNQELDLYIMVNYGVSDPKRKYWDGWRWKCQYLSSLGFWYSESPYGQLTQFSYTEYFYADRKENRKYGFKLSPKWISEDGKIMILKWSDSGDNQSTNYKWNQTEIEIVTK